METQPKSQHQQERSKEQPLTHEKRLEHSRQLLTEGAALIQQSPDIVRGGSNINILHRPRYEFGPSVSEILEVSQRTISQSELINQTMRVFNGVTAFPLT